MGALLSYRSPRASHQAVGRMFGGRWSLMPYRLWSPDHEIRCCKDGRLRTLRTSEQCLIRRSGWDAAKLLPSLPGTEVGAAASYLASSTVPRLAQPSRTRIHRRLRPVAVADLEFAAWRAARARRHASASRIRS